MRTTKDAPGRPPQVFDLLLVGLCLGVGVVLPLAQGTGLAEVVITTATGVSATAAAMFTLTHHRGVVMFVVLMVGAAIGSQLGVSSTWFITWVFAVFAGVVVGADLAHWWRRRA